MMYLDSFIRFSALGMMLFLIVLSLRDLNKSRSVKYLLLSCISVSAAFMTYTPDYLQLPYYLKLVLRFLDVPHLVFVWLFALSLFQQNFKIKPFHMLVGIIYSIPIFMVRLAQYGVLNGFPFWGIIIIDVMSIALMMHLMYTTLSGRSDDLRERRRTSRIYFVLVVAFIAIASALLEVIMTGDLRSYIYTAKIAVMWPAIMFTSFWLLHINQYALSFGSTKLTQSTQQLSPQDHALIKKLKYSMNVHHVYLENDISIVGLAKVIGTTQHKLRSLINSYLGHENFSSFINSYRIDAIKQAFNDPSNSHKPILTIALEHGFNSLSPFNRAFRLTEGVTPSEYRKLTNK